MYVPSESGQNLRSLCRQYRMIVQSITRVKNRIKAHLHYNGIQYNRESSCWSGDFIAYLRDLPLDEGPAKSGLNLHLDELEEHRRRKVRILKELGLWVSQRGAVGVINNLRSVPGVGLKSALILYTEIMDIHRFKTWAI